MRKRNEMRKYQNAAVDFIKEKKRCGLFVDPGLGKTAISLTAFGDLIDDMDCGMVLVIAPPRVAKKTWPDEFREWAHTHDKSFVHIKGTPEKRRTLLRRKVCYHLISIDLVPWLLKEMGGHYPDRGRIRKLLDDSAYADPKDTPQQALLKRKKSLAALGVPSEKLEGCNAEEVEALAAKEAKRENRWRPPTRCLYDAIAVDESSKVKAHNSNRFKALRLIAPRVEYFLILTGTPAANGYTDLWSQIYLLDAGERLGVNITDFRGRWCRENYNGHGYSVEDYAIKVIEERISDIVFTLREEDYANLPPRMYNDIVLQFDDATAKKYKAFEKTYILEIADEKHIRVKDGAAITNKLSQLANGVVYDAEKNEHEFHDIKLEALADLIEEVNGQPVLVAYHFKSDLRRLKKKFPNAVEFTKDATIQDRWNRGEIPILLAHPQSVAHGLNLQFGGNVAVWYTLPWSLENYIQFNKRLHRSGQTRPVMIHHLMVEGTIDDDARAALNRKDDMQESLLNSLKKRIKLYV